MTDQQKKYFTYGGIGIVIAVLGYYAFKGSNNSGDATDPTGNGGIPSPNVGYVFNAQKIAKELLDAMKDSGTDELTILDSLSKVNQTQFGLVFQAFGKHSYNRDLGNQTAFVWQTLPKLDLKQWLFEELSSSDYKVLKLKYPNYL
jgi:Annexin